MSFIEHFAIVDDPRKNINVKHDLLDVLFLTVSAVISGAGGWYEWHIKPYMQGRWH